MSNNLQNQDFRNPRDPFPPSMPETIDDDEPVKVETTNDARQGVTGNNVRYVLGISLAAIIVVMIALAFFSSHL